MAISVIDATSTGSTGTVMVSGNMPAFSAYQSSAQTISSGTFTKVQLQTKEFDTANAFDNTTNFRFTPQVAGYYQVNGCVVTNFYCQCVVLIYKNGANYKQGSLGYSASGFSPETNVSSLVYLNGSTDYIEFYIIANASGGLNVGANLNYFNAALVRAA